jgi:hypothetical protein
MTNKKQKKNNKPPIKRLNISNTSQDSTKNKIVALFILILLLTSGIGIFLLRRVNFNEKNSLDNIDNKDKLAVEDVKKDKLSNNLLFNTTSKSKIKKFNTPKHEPTNLEFIEKIKKKLKFHEDFRGTEKEKMNITEHYVNIILNLAKNSSSKAHYINFVLSKSSKFTLLIMPNNFSTANYNELTNAMQLPSDFSADPLAREQSSLITLSHEFWHAYMAILHSCEFNMEEILDKLGKNCSPAMIMEKIGLIAEDLALGITDNKSLIVYKIPDAPSETSVLLVDLDGHGQADGSKPPEAVKKAFPIIFKEECATRLKCEVELVDIPGTYHSYGRFKNNSLLITFTAKFQEIFARLARHRQEHSILPVHYENREKHFLNLVRNIALYDSNYLQLFELACKNTQGTKKSTSKHYFPLLEEIMEMLCSNKANFGEEFQQFIEDLQTNNTGLAKSIVATYKAGKLTREEANISSQVLQEIWQYRNEPIAKKPRLSFLSKAPSMLVANKEATWFAGKWLAVVDALNQHDEESKRQDKTLAGHYVKRREHLLNLLQVCNAESVDYFQLFDDALKTTQGCSPFTSQHYFPLLKEIKEALSANQSNFKQGFDHFKKLLVAECDNPLSLAGIIIQKIVVVAPSQENNSNNNSLIM